MRENSFRLLTKSWVPNSSSSVLVRAKGPASSLYLLWGIASRDIVYDDIHYENREYDPRSAHGRSSSTGAAPSTAFAHFRCIREAGKGGVFCTNSEIAELEEGTASMAIEERDRRTSKVAPYADPASAERLWTISETMKEVGLLI